jgi:hypothetical protein
LPFVRIAAKGPRFPFMVIPGGVAGKSVLFLERQVL